MSVRLASLSLSIALALSVASAVGCAGVDTGSQATDGTPNEVPVPSIVTRIMTPGGGMVRPSGAVYPTRRAVLR